MKIKKILISLMISLLIIMSFSDSIVSFPVNAEESKEIYIIAHEGNEEVLEALAETDADISQDIAVVEATYSELQMIVQDQNVMVETEQIVTLSGQSTPVIFETSGLECFTDTDFQGKGIKVAILDTGVDIENNDIALAGGVSFVGDSYDDDNGHGTAIASIIGSLNNDSGMVGVAPEAQIYAVKVLDDQGNGYYSNVLKGLNWCIEEHMDIVLMSFGGKTYSALLEETINTATGCDMLLVGAAGNTDSGVDYPAAFDSVVAIGSVDKEGIREAYSNYGDQLDYVMLGNDITGYDNQNNLVTNEGTSISAALFVGLAADLWGYDKTRSNKMIQGIIDESVITNDAVQLYGKGEVKADLVYLNKDLSVDVSDSEVVVPEGESPDGQVSKSGIVKSGNIDVNIGESLICKIGFSESHDSYFYKIEKNGELIESNTRQSVDSNPIIGNGNDTPIEKYDKFVDFISDTKFTELGQYIVTFSAESGGQIHSFGSSFAVVESGGSEPPVPVYIPDFTLSGYTVEKKTAYYVNEVIQGYASFRNLNTERVTSNPIIKVEIIDPDNRMVFSKNYTMTLFPTSNEGVTPKVDFKPVKTGTYKVKCTISDSAGKETNVSNNTLVKPVEIKVVPKPATAVDVNNHSTVTVGDPVDVKTGKLTFQVEDLSIDGVMPISVERKYQNTYDNKSLIGKNWNINFFSHFTIESPTEMQIIFVDGSLYFINTDEDGTLRYDTNAFDAVEWNNDGSLSVIDKKQSRYRYRSDGQLISITNSKGLIVDCIYNSENRLTRVESVSGSFEFEYENQLIRRITDNSGRTIEYGYDGGMLTSITNVLGDTWRYVYDSEGSLVESYDYVGKLSLKNTYDEQGRIIEQFEADGGKATFSYDDNAMTTTFVDKAGNSNIYYQDANGRIETRTEAGLTSKYVFDAAGNLTKVTDKTGNSTYYAYDNQGNRIQVTDALGQITTYQYNGKNELIATVYPDGRRTEQVYDNQGNIIEQVDALGYKTIMTYNFQGQMLTRTLPNGAAATYIYDSKSNLEFVIDALGNKTQYTYDGLNRVQTVIAADGGTTKYGYNLFGDIIDIQYPDGSRTTKVVDKQGRTLSESDRLGNTTTYSYDEMGRVAKVINPLGESNTYSYDALGNLTEINYADGSKSTFEYDSKNNMIKEIDPLGAITQYEYDLNGRRTKVKDPLGSETIYVYDAIGRTLEVYNDSILAQKYQYGTNGRVISETDRYGATTNYSYDKAGHVLTVTDGMNHSTSYTYTATGEVATVTNPVGDKTTYEYDLIGEKSKVIYADQSMETFTYDEMNRLISQTDALGRITQYSYDLVGNQIETILPNGSRISKVFDSMGNQLAQSDALGNKSYTTYDQLGRVTSELDPRGNKTTYEYEAFGHKITITSPDGSTQSVTYDTVGNPKQITNSLGNNTLITYNQLGQKSSVTDSLGNKTMWEYDDEGQIIQETDANGGITGFVYDGNRLVSKVSALGGTTTYTYDLLGRKLSEQNPTGSTIQWEYDSMGRVICVFDGNGNPTKYTYRYDDKILNLTDSLGNVIANEYDKAGQLIKTTDKLGAVTSYTYTATGQIESLIDPLNAKTSYAYDVNDRLVGIQFANHSQTQFCYDENGNRVEIINPQGIKSSTQYDSMNRPIQITDGLGQTTKMNYNLGGQLVTQTDQLGRVDTFSYDPIGQLSQKTNTLGQTINYTYNNLGDLIKVDNQGITEEYTYDLSRNLLSEKTPEGSITNHIYDLANRNIKTIDGLGQIISREYDQNNNLVLVNYEMDKKVSFTYNPLNQMTAMTDWTGTTKYDYDGQGHLIKETNPNGQSIVYTYNAGGQQTSIKYPDNSLVQYTYDEMSNIIKIMDNDNKSTVFGYDKIGQLISKSLPNGGITHYQYDSIGQLIGMDYQIGSNKPFEVYSYTYDGVGNQTREVKSVPKNKWTNINYTTDYTYDDLNQLVGVKDSTGRVEKYTYDKYGNRVQKDVTTPTNGCGKKSNTDTIKYTYNDAYQLISMQGKNAQVGGYETNENIQFTYDANGELTQIGTKNKVIGQYTFDATGKMVGVKDANGLITEYTYNGIGSKINENSYEIKESRCYKPIDAIENIDYIVSSLNQKVLMSIGDTKDLQRIVYDVNGMPLSEKSWDSCHGNCNGYGHVIGHDCDEKNENHGGGKNHCFDCSFNQCKKAHENTIYNLTDYQGTVSYTLDSKGKLKDSNEYDSFGVPEDSKGKPGNITELFSYTGYQYNESNGLMYANARYYIPELGRFNAKDSYRGDGLNRYLYVGNNPIRWVDPTGYCGEGYGKNGTNSNLSIGDQLKVMITISPYVARTLLANEKANITTGINNGTNDLGWASYGILSALVEEVTFGLLKDDQEYNNVAYNFSKTGTQIAIAFFAFKSVTGSSGTGTLKFKTPTLQPVGGELITAELTLNGASTLVDAATLVQALKMMFSSGDSKGTGKTVFSTTDDAANVVSKNLNGTMSELNNGYKIEIPNGNKPIVVRIMNEGSGGRTNPYFRVSIDGKGSLTLDGTLSSDRALTHIDMGDNYLQQITDMINKYIGK